MKIIGMSIMKSILYRIDYRVMFSQIPYHDFNFKFATNRNANHPYDNVRLERIIYALMMRPIQRNAGEKVYVS